MRGLVRPSRRRRPGFRAPGSRAGAGERRRPRASSAPGKRVCVDLCTKNMADPVAAFGGAAAVAADPSRVLAAALSAHDATRGQAEATLKIMRGAPDTFVGAMMRVRAGDALAWAGIGVATGLPRGPSRLWRTGAADASAPCLALRLRLLPCVPLSARAAPPRR